MQQLKILAVLDPGRYAGYGGRDRALRALRRAEEAAAEAREPWAYQALFQVALEAAEALPREALEAADERLDRLHIPSWEGWKATAAFQGARTRVTATPGGVAAMEPEEIRQALWRLAQEHRNRGSLASSDALAAAWGEP